MASIEELKKHYFYYEDATRAHAEAILRGEPTKICIVRPSTQPGAVSVSWSEPDRIRHSLIDIKDGWYVTEVEDGTSLKFAQMETLLDFLKLIPFNSPKHKELLGAASGDAYFNMHTVQYGTAPPLDENYDQAMDDAEAAAPPGSYNIAPPVPAAAEDEGDGESTLFDGFVESAMPRTQKLKVEDVAYAVSQPRLPSFGFVTAPKEAPEKLPEYMPMPESLDLSVKDLTTPPNNRISAQHAAQLGYQHTPAALINQDDGSKEGEYLTAPEGLASVSKEGTNSIHLEYTEANPFALGAIQAQQSVVPNAAHNATATSTNTNANNEQNASSLYDPMVFAAGGSSAEYKEVPADVVVGKEKTIEKKKSSGKDKDKDKILKKLDMKVQHLKGERLDNLSLQSLEALRGTLVKSLQRVNAQIDAKLLGTGGSTTNTLQRGGSSENKRDKKEKKDKAKEKAKDKERRDRDRSNKDKEKSLGRKKSKRSGGGASKKKDDNLDNMVANVVLVDDDGKELIAFDAND